MSNWLYVLSVSEIILAIILIHATQGHISFTHFERPVVFEIYGVLAFGTILRVFANETSVLRKKQEELTKKAKILHAQKKEIYLLVNNISDGVISVDSKKEITFINKSALSILRVVGGYKHFVGKNIDDIIPVVSSEGKVSVVDKSLNEKVSVIRNDLRLVKTDKTLRLHTNVNPVFDEKNKIIGAIVLFRDISLQKEIEEQRAEFNAIASHELRTPLTVIEGYLYYLLNDRKLKYDKETESYLAKTYEAASNLLHLSNDILTVVKSDENKIEVALEKVDLGKIAKETIKGFDNKAKEKKIKLIYNTLKNLPQITTDKQKIKEVITNLLENAIKFTDKGSVKLEISSENDNEVLITVTDTGVGIATEDQRMIFHKFYRTEDWKTRKTGGTGLGLYIAKTFVTRLGGEIGVDSKKGKGSTFWVTLPVSGKKRKSRKSSQRDLNEFIKSI